MANLNYDGLVNAPSKEVALASMQLLNVLQDHKPHLQAAATAVVFLLLCEHYRANPQDVFTAVKNLLANDIHGEHPQFRALRLYIKHEVSQ